MKKSLILLSIISLLFILFAFECEDSVDSQRLFQKSFEVNSDQQPIAIGDTVWLEVDVLDNVLEDRRSGEEIELVNALYSVQFTLFGFQEVYNSDIEYFDLIVENGSVDWSPYSNTYNYLIAEFGCNEPSILKIGFVFNVSGVYAISSFGYAWIGHGANYDCEEETYCCNSDEIFLYYQADDFNKSIYDNLSQERKDLVNRWDVKEAINNHQIYFFEIQN